MYKHSTTHRTLSRRLAALLAALALLAAMALPVYAEALEDATGTAQAEIGDTISDSTVTTEDDSTTPEGKEAAEDSTANADGNNASENEDTKDNASSSTTGDSNTTAGDAANDTPQILPDDNIDPTASKTTMDDTPDTMDEAAKQNIVTQSTDDAETADDAATDNEIAASSVTYPVWVYVAVKDDFQEGWTVKFNSNMAINGDNWLVMQSMAEQLKPYNGRKVFGFELTEKNCPNGGYSRIQFFPFDSSGNKQNNFYEASNKWMDIKDFANKLYDAQTGEWKNNYKPFDPTDHTAFSGKTMAFKNASTGELTNVVAHFYEKDANGTLREVERQNFNNNVPAGEKVDFTIPLNDKPCGFVQFTAGEPEKIISSIYNFYGQKVGTGEESFLYNEETQFCFVYSANNMAHWGTGEGQRTIYYDATFSKLSADTEFAIPSNVGGKVYYYLTSEKEGKAGKAGEMTRQTNDLYSVDIEDGYDHIIFGAYKPTSATNVAGRGNSTANLEIPDEYTSPCFYADTGDDSTYGGANWNTDLTRGGYWAEVNTLRDAEKGKGKTNDPVVNIQPATFNPDPATKYINTTLYDYYTDWELNGNNRGKYDVSNGASQRNWVTFRQFDQALSDYYIAYNSTNKEGKSVAYPIYTGHFQPDYLGGDKFSNIADKLNLYGWSRSESDYNTFISVNNSATNIKGTHNLGSNDDKDIENYNWTFQGLVSKNLSADGTLTMYGTDLSEPHFSKDFLEGDNSKKAVLGKVYENVSFPFTKENVFNNGVDYWYYDAGKKSLYLKQGTDNKYFLQAPDGGGTDDRSKNVNSSSGELGTYGFFPFNEKSSVTHANTYNYGFGAKLQFDFTLTDDGQVLDNNGKKVPIQFFFSGDDDVWVYIDNELALDVGGAHGKASGLLEFGTNKAGKLVYTPYVSKVKTGNEQQSYEPCGDANVKKITYLGNQISFYYKGKGDPKEISAGKHTLKFFYMERGMWESNMAIAFNFPDHNELQVEKQVDLTNVPDEEFAACFTNQKLFNFTILNQATHYGTKPVESDSVQQVNPITLSSTDYTLGRMGNLENNSNNYCEGANDPDKKNTGNNTGQVIHWYAEYDDTHSAYRKERMGVITLGKSVDITGMDYLSFYIYASGQKGEGTLSLSNMYLQLVDSGGNVLGCHDEESLSGTTYNQVDLKNNEWIKIKLDLSRLTRDSSFDMTQLKEIRIGDNFQRDIYFKDFTFTANPTIKKITGFTTEQKDIPDYGSAADGELKLAESAQFSSSIDGKTRAVDKNGQFTLQDKEVVTFSDQFRRGSYLSVTEDADLALFDTTWTIYENGVQVKTMNSGKTVQNADPAPSVVEQRSYTPNDGRTEKTSTVIGLTGDDNSYNGEKPKEKAIVFRSYTNPDAGEAAELTKLKLQFVNKVKTGSLTIKKAAAENEDDEIKRGTYTFTVTFTDVGGLGLESKPIVKKIEIEGVGEKTITGIPVGTRFHIVETGATNNANVSGVTVTGGGSDCKVVNGKEAIGSIVEYKQDEPSTVAVATFTNTTRTLIDIDLTKQWVDADDQPLAEDKLPNTTIYVQLQRRTTSDAKWETVLYPEGTEQDYVEVKRYQGGWTYKFANLDANDYKSQDITKPVYQYRVVEGVLESGQFVAKKPVTDAFLLSDGYAYTYTGNEMQTTTTGGKTSNTITLTNKRLDPKFALDIIKNDAENTSKHLEGVVFTLEKVKSNGNGNFTVDSSFTTRTGVTNGNGELMWKKDDDSEVEGFTDLEAGTYRLTETKAAKEYNLLSEPIIITFTKDGKCQVGADIYEEAKENTIFTGNAAEGYTLSLTVLNRKTPALPHTGADAPSLWLLIGLPLAVAGLLILVFRYNKKGGRTR